MDTIYEYLLCRLLPGINAPVAKRVVVDYLVHACVSHPSGTKALLSHSQLGFGIIGRKSRKQGHKLEVARAILILGTGGGLNKRKMYHRCRCYL